MKFRLLFVGAGLLALSGLAMASPVFTQATAAAGLTDIGAAQGPLWGDYDGDLDEDLVLCVDVGGSARLFNNNGSGVFTEVPTSFTGLLESNAGTWFDFDDDGDLDIFFGAVFQPSEFFVNNGNGTFTENSALFSATDTDFDNIFAVVAGDFTVDGAADLFMSPFSAAVGPNNLWQNGGLSGFTDIATSPLSDTLTSPRAANGIDFDNDGDMDIYLNNTGPANSVLFRNDGAGVFVDATNGNPLDDFGRSGRGSAWGDLDNDGDLDLVVANGDGAGNVIARNDGAGVFTDVSAAPFSTGVSIAICPVIFDFNNDGNLDLFVHTLDGTSGGPGGLYQGDGALGFTDVTATAAPELLTDLMDGRSASVADVDNDGDLDLYRGNGSTSLGGGNSHFYRNGTNNTNWLKVRVVGTFSDPQGFGTQVAVYDSGTSNLVGYSQVQSQSGYEGFNSLVQHFGVPSSGTYDVYATFPRFGYVVSAEAVATAQTITLTEAAPPSARSEGWENYQ